ncbi:MAG: aminotransferase class I/II-fold pyridoxal phosphate-dependent enzyme [Nannocystaceae bacterium]|nr:aminotransferase class I/II-fold pyridoxal phosphate-dependent enzyme [Nannocystaceae bacterium]
MALTTRAAKRLAALEADDLLRQPPAISQRHGVAYRLAGVPVVGFCSNDYLGLAGEPTASAGHATGAGASRLIAGDLSEHRDVEARLALVCRSEDAVLFPSGFQLNVGVIAALVDPSDRVHSDRLNHASIIDGLRLARARLTVLDHRATPASTTAGRDTLDWWFTESVFSMDGDRLDKHALATYQREGGTVYVDEAHAFGLFPGGAGLLHDHALQPDVLVGTLSKAYGCAGAFVAASSDVCRLIRNRARSFVFSTGVAPTVVADIAARIEFLTGEGGDARRTSLWRNVRRLDAALRGIRPDDSDAPSPIIPILVGDNRTALRIAARLLNEGIHVQAIRPPTVPQGTARLRLTVSASHSLAQIDRLATLLHTVLAEEGLPLQTMGQHARPSPTPTPTSAPQW